MKPLPLTTTHPNGSAVQSQSRAKYNIQQYTTTHCTALFHMPMQKYF